MMTPDQDRRAHDRVARRTAWRLESLASGFVALLALFISAYTVYINRLQLKAQAWPRLALVGELPAPQAGGGAATGIVLSLKNSGVAPAEVRSMRVTVRNQRIDNWADWLKVLMKNQGVNLQAHLSTAASPLGEVVGVGESLKLFETDSEEIQLLIEGDDESILSFCYCSNLEDCWVLETPGSGAPKTTSVRSCPSSEPFEGIPLELVKAEVRKRRAAAGMGMLDGG